MVAAVASSDPQGAAARSAAAGAAERAATAGEPVDAGHGLHAVASAADGVLTLRRLNADTPLLRAQFTTVHSGADAPLALSDMVDGLAAEMTAGLERDRAASAARYVTQDGAGLVIQADGADDRIELAQAATGELLIDINGVSHRFDAARIASVTIRTLGGNDSVRVDEGVRTAVTVDGGDGDDVLVGGAGGDTIDGGAGRDYVSGGTGDDHIRGGDGDDTLYGGTGRDALNGDGGKDYLDGWRGTDVLSGGAQADVISSVPGEDQLPDPADGDVVYAATAESRAAVPRDIVLAGSAEFQARMHADLETLAASETGAAMLAEISRLTAAGGRLVIEQSRIENGLAGGNTIMAHVLLNPAYGPAQEHVPPIIVLYHELAHARAALAGTWAPGLFADAAQPGHADTGMPNAERQAMGLPLDHDLDPATPAMPDPATPAALTENALRAEMGLRLRQSY